MNDPKDPETLLAKIRDLEALCTDVLVAGVDVGLPQPLLNQLWAAVGSGEEPQAFCVDLPPGPRRPVEPPPAAAAVSKVAVPTPFSEQPRTTPSGPRELLPIPNVPLAVNPQAPQDDSRPKPPQVELKPLTIRKTVCVVDDDSMMLDVLGRILRRENYDLLMASSGTEIIQLLTTYSGHIDLLVTDYAMPGMQGRELADAVRQKFPALRVLYQTGFSDMLFKDREELEDGAAFLEKPFTARGLREAARLVLFGSINP